MTPDANALDLDSLRKIAEAATRRNFFAQETAHGACVMAEREEDSINALAYKPDIANARLFAAAANALPALLAELRELRAANARLRNVAEKAKAYIEDQDEDRSATFDDLCTALAAPATPSDSSGAGKGEG